MTRGIKIEVGDGWSAIVLNLIVIGSAYPEHWNFKFHRAWRNSGRMRIYVTTDNGDPASLDATVALSEIAWHRSGHTCEVCGRGGCLRLGKRYALTLCRGTGSVGFPAVHVSGKSILRDTSSVCRGIRYRSM